MKIFESHIGKTFICTMRCGKEIEPLTRKLSKVKKNELVFLREDGKESPLEIKNLSMCEIDWNTFKTFFPLERPLNEEEKAEMQRVKKQLVNSFGGEEKYKEACERDSMSDGSTTYRREKEYGDKSPLAYLFSSHTIKGQSKFIIHNFWELWIRDHRSPDKNKIEMLYTIS